jgi:hypothetical protein
MSKKFEEKKITSVEKNTSVEKITSFAGCSFRM